MKAFVLAKYNKPLELRDVAEPTVGADEALVLVEAAGLNQLDERTCWEISSRSSRDS